MLNYDDEIWKPVKEFEDRYLISSYGRVMSLQTNAGKAIQRLKTLSPSRNGQYVEVQLFIKDVVYHKAVHRLVAEAFLDNPAGKPFVNHKDGNKVNNHVDNLEWCTCQENIQHAWDTGLNRSNADALKGIKWGSTSKYNNVTYDKSRDRWIASMKQDQKTLFQKRFKTENEAAEYVNTMIDLLQLDRPRNIII